MSENTPYFESITAARSMKVGAEDFADATISLETQSDLAKDSVGESIRDNFGRFLPFLRHLNPEDQELLMSYYLLSKPQWCLAKLYRSTQTLCSFRIRMALKKLGVAAMHDGHPPVAVLDDILVLHDVNQLIDGVRTSTIVDEYRHRRSFTGVADALHLHRPDVRRALTKAVNVLMDDQHEEHVAFGAYIHGLIDKASITGTGFSARKIQKHSHLHKADPNVVGAFRINVTDPSFDEHVLVSRASY